MSPSDLSFLLRECVRCFFRKTVYGLRRPSVPPPRVFTVLDRRQREYFDGKRTDVLHVGLPRGTLHCIDLAVASTEWSFPELNVAVRFRCSMDAVIALDEGTYGIVDFKTVLPG